MAFHDTMFSVFGHITTASLQAKTRKSSGEKVSCAACRGLE